LVQCSITKGDAEERERERGEERDCEARRGGQQPGSFVRIEAKFTDRLTLTDHTGLKLKLPLSQLFHSSRYFNELRIEKEVEMDPA